MPELEEPEFRDKFTKQDIRCDTTDILRKLAVTDPITPINKPITNNLHLLHPYSVCFAMPPSPDEQNLLDEGNDEGEHVHA